MPTESGVEGLTVVLERLAAVEVHSAEQMQLGTGSGSGSILCEARYVGSAGHVAGRIEFVGSGAKGCRASLERQGDARKSIPNKKMTFQRRATTQTNA